MYLDKASALKKQLQELERFLREGRYEENGDRFKEFVFEHQWMIPPFELQPSNATEASWYRAVEVGEEELKRLRSECRLKISRIGYLEKGSPLNRCNQGGEKAFYLSDHHEVPLKETLNL